MKQIAKVSIAILCLVLTGIFGARANQTDKMQMTPYKGSADFERLKSLAGSWQEGNWKMYADGKQTGEVIFNLSRVK